MAKAGGKIGAGDREKFLVAVESITMFFCKHAPDRSGLDRSEKKACKREWQKIRDVVPAHHRQRGQRQSARNFTQQLDAVTAKIHQRCCRNPTDNDEKRDGLVRQETLSQDEQRQCGQTKH